MIDLINKIRQNRYFLKYPILKQFTKFSLVGVSNTAIDFFIYLVLTRIFSVYFLIANIISFLTAVSWSFVFNKHWTFRNSETAIRSQYFEFLVINLIGLILNTTILYWLVRSFRFYDLLAKVTAVIIVLFWNFGASRYWIFRNNN